VSVLEAAETLHRNLVSPSRCELEVAINDQVSLRFEGINMRTCSMHLNEAVHENAKAFHDKCETAIRN
jgi:hypothetical protein